MSTAVATPPQTPPPKATPSPAPPPMASTPPVPATRVVFGVGSRLHPITVKQYQQMIATGILAAENVELIDGLMVEKMSRNPLHDGTLGLVQKAIRTLPPPTWLIRVQSAVELPASQPEPDVCLVRGDERSFLTRHPLPHEVGLLIEVADSSLAFDRREKLASYAAAGGVEYWIVNLVDNRVEVYTQPSGPAIALSYGSLQTLAAGQSIPLTLDGLTVATVPVADLLP